MDEQRLAHLIAEAHRRFGQAGGVYRAPGRVNLIGDHTDYQEGFVLPLAVDRDTWCVARQRPDRLLRLVSLDLEPEASCSLDHLEPAALPGWARYPAGVAWALEQAGYRLSGLDLLIQTTLPLGAGLSSSAALELACAFALEWGSGFTLPPRENALLCQRAEQQFAGVPCGIMDQYVAAHAVAGAALLIDCRTIEHQLVPIPTAATLVVFDSGLRRQLADSRYPERRRETERAAAVLRAQFPEVRTLRDATLEMVAAVAAQLSPAEQRRARHVVSENARVLAAATALAAGDLTRVGILMNESHESLRRDFESSLPPIDRLVDLCREHGAIGARITGGGFGGAVVALLAGQPAQPFAEQVVAAYQQETGLVATALPVRPAAGAGPVAREEQRHGLVTRTLRLPDGRSWTAYRFEDD